MGLLPAVMAWGKITIDSTNNKVHFRETNGTTPSDRTATITDGEYFPDSTVGAESLLTQIAAQMTSASTYGATYNCTLSDMGVPTITAAGGTLTGFHLMITTAETAKLLTGGDQTAGLQGFNSFGWLVDSSYPSYALTVTGDTQVINAWYPDGPRGAQPPNSLDPIDRMAISEVETLGGRQVARNFTGAVGPHQTHYKEELNIGFKWLTDSCRLAYRNYFYLPYACTGGLFRYFADKSDLSAYEERTLRGESLTTNQPIRLAGYPWFQWVVRTKLYKP